MSPEFIYLASQSPRRAQLLGQLGVEHELLLAQPDEDAEALETELVDQPFSCRFRVDEGTLTIRDLKFGTLDRRDSTNWGGRFRWVVPSNASAVYNVPGAPTAP